MRLSLELWTLSRVSILLVVDSCFNIDSWAEGALFHLLCQNFFLVDSCEFCSLSLLLVLISMESIADLFGFSVHTSGIWILLNVIIPIGVWYLLSVLWSRSKLIVNLFLPGTSLSLLVSSMTLCVVNRTLIIHNWSCLSILKSPVFVLIQISCILIHIIIIIIILNICRIIIIVILLVTSIVLLRCLNIATLIYILNTYCHCRLFFVTLSNEVWREWCWSFGFVLIMINIIDIMISLYLLLLSHFW